MLNRFSIKGRMYLIIVSILVLFLIMIGFAVDGSNRARDLAIEKTGRTMLEDQKDKLKVATHSIALAIGRSIEKINTEFNSDDMNNWHYCVNDGTPTRENSVYQEPEDIGGSAHFKISPKTATPNDDGENDNLLIAYQFDSSYIYLTMKVYNIKGQLISKPLNGEYSASKGNIVWNCKNDNGMTVDTGAYICLLKAKDDNGKVVELKEAFYIAK